MFISHWTEIANDKSTYTLFWVRRGIALWDNHVTECKFEISRGY